MKLEITWAVGWKAGGDQRAQTFKSFVAVLSRSLSNIWISYIADSGAVRGTQKVTDRTVLRMKAEFLGWRLPCWDSQGPIILLQWLSFGCCLTRGLEGKKFINFIFKDQSQILKNLSVKSRKSDFTIKIKNLAFSFSKEKKKIRKE